MRTTLDTAFNDVFSVESCKKHGLSTRSHAAWVNAAKLRDLETLGDVAALSQTDFANAGIGKPTRTYITTVLTEFGITAESEDVLQYCAAKKFAQQGPRYISLVKGIIRAMLYMQQNGGTEYNPWKALYHAKPELVDEHVRMYLPAIFAENKRSSELLQSKEKLDAIANKDYWAVWEAVNRHIGIRPPFIAAIVLEE